MGNVFISLDEEHEEMLRRLAEEKYQRKKGAISKVVENALELIASKDHEEAEKKKARKKMLDRMENTKLIIGMKNGVAYTSRDELYDR